MGNVVDKLPEVLSATVAVAVIWIKYDPESVYLLLIAVKSRKDPESMNVSQVGNAVPSANVTAWVSVNYGYCEFV